MIVNQSSNPSTLPFIKSIQLNQEVNHHHHHFINHDLNSTSLEFDDFDQFFKFQNHHHHQIPIQNYHFLQFSKSNSTDFIPSDLNHFLLQQQQQQYPIQPSQTHFQESCLSSLSSSPSSRSSNLTFNEPDRLHLSNFNQFESSLPQPPQPLHHESQLDPTSPSSPSSNSQLRLQSITPPLENLSSSYPISSLNSSPISHSSLLPFDQTLHSDLKPELDELNSASMVPSSDPSLLTHDVNLNLHFHLNSFDSFNPNHFHQTQSFQLLNSNFSIPIQSSSITSFKPKPKSKSNQTHPTLLRQPPPPPPRKSNQIKPIQAPEKKFGCLICNKHFARAFNLQTHIATHKGIKPFKCPSPLCQKSFSRRHDLSRHLNSLHSSWLKSLKLNSHQIVSKLKLDDQDKLLLKTCSDFFQI